MSVVVDGLSNLPQTVASNLPQTVASGMAYQPFGDLTLMTDGNGEVRTLSRDQDGRLTYVTSGTHQTLQLEYDPTDQIDNITNYAQTTTTHTLQYIPDGRLTFVNPTALAQSWTFDANGNRS